LPVGQGDASLLHFPVAEHCCPNHINQFGGIIEKNGQPGGIGKIEKIIGVGKMEKNGHLPKSLKNRLVADPCFSE
jgi:hypothetical protein